MKRVIVTLMATVSALVATATVALAQYPPTSQPPTDPVPGSAPGGGTLPFTGASISWWLVILSALVLTGVVLLFMGRRRRVH
jgi:LPXTG-motif cell wall-anchored protein